MEDFVSCFESNEKVNVIFVLQLCKNNVEIQ